MKLGFLIALTYIICVPSLTLAQNQSIQEINSLLLNADLTPLEKGELYTKKGQLCFNNGKPLDAIDAFEKSMIYYESSKDTILYCESLNWTASTYENLGDISKALEYYYNCAEIQSLIGDEIGRGYSLVSIGYNTVLNGDFKGGGRILNESLEIFQRLDNKHGLAMTYSNLAFIESEKGNLDSALNYHQKAFMLVEEMGDTVSMAYGYKNIGEVFFRKNNLAMAEIQYQLSIELFELESDPYGSVIAMNLIAQLYLQEADLEKTKTYAKKALKLATETDFPSGIRDASKILYQVYEKENNGQLAHESFKTYIQMRDSLDNIENQKTAIYKEAQYQLQKQQELDEVNHQKDIKIEKEAQRQQKIILSFVLFGASIISVLLIIVFKRLKTTRKQKRVIEGQKFEIEEQHKEISDSINYAERIQRSFLATEELLKNNLGEHFIYFNPKEAVSGDFYWAGKLANGNFAVSCADSTGHGVPGAIMSILNISSIEKAVENKASKPAEIFNQARKLIIERLKKDGSPEGGKDGMDASLISFNPEKTLMQYVAAHNPIWVIRAGELIDIKAEKMPVGKHDHDHIPFEGGEFELQKGDIVYTLTDGYQDQFGGEKGKKYKVKPFKRLLLDICELPMSEQYQKISEAFNEWKRDLEQVDDVCVIGVRI